MRERSPRLPGFWRFVWLFWMQPVTLHRLLRSLGVDPTESGWKILRRRRSPSENWWLVRLAQMLLTIELLWAAVLFAGETHVDWLATVLAVTLGVPLVGAIVGAIDNVTIS